jgi:AcrR family transcriptional regulator
VARPPRGEQPSPDAIVQAAVQCYVRDGYEQTTLREIAKQVGIPVSRIYLTFDHKNSLDTAVRAWINRHVLEAYVMPELEGERAPWDRIMSLAGAYLQFYRDEKPLATLMITMPLAEDQNDPGARALERAQSEQAVQLMKVLRELTAETGSEIDPGDVIRWCWGALIGLVSINVRLPHLAVDDEELDKIVGLGLRFVRSGLAEDARQRSSAR